MGQGQGLREEWAPAQPHPATPSCSPPNKPSPLTSGQEAVSILFGILNSIMKLQVLGKNESNGSADGC